MGEIKLREGTRVYDNPVQKDPGVVAPLPKGILQSTDFDNGARYSTLNNEHSTSTVLPWIPARQPKKSSGFREKGKTIYYNNN